MLLTFGLSNLGLGRNTLSIGFLKLEDKVVNLVVKFRILYTRFSDFNYISKNISAPNQY